MTWSIDVTQPPYNCGAGSDDTAAIQAAINAANGQAILEFPFPPAGIYRIETGPVIIGADNTNIMGSTDATTITSYGIDNTLFSIEADSVQMSNLLLYGKGCVADTGTFGAANPVLVVRGNASTGATGFNCTLRDVSIQGGSVCLQHMGNELKMDNVHLAYAYGAALLYTTVDPVMGGDGSILASNVFCDNNWDPACGGGYPGTLCSIPAWAASTPVVYQQLALHPSGYYIQCRVAGTTGASAPTLANYQNDITDGTAIWRLVCGSNLAACELDTGTYEVYIDRFDMTGAAVNGLRLSNTLGGAAPQYVRLSKAIASRCLGSCIKLDAGGLIWLTDPEVASAVQTSADALITQGGFTGPLQIKGGSMFGNSWGMVHTAGEAKCNGVSLSGAVGGFYTNVGNCTVTDNVISGPNAVFVDSGSSNYVVVNNRSGGAAYTDSGSAPKIMGPNI